MDVSAVVILQKMLALILMEYGDATSVHFRDRANVCADDSETFSKIPKTSGRRRMPACMTIKKKQTGIVTQ